MYLNGVEARYIYRYVTLSSSSITSTQSSHPALRCQKAGGQCHRVSKYLHTPIPPILRHDLHSYIGCQGRCWKPNSAENHSHPNANFAQICEKTSAVPGKGFGCTPQRPRRNRPRRWFRWTGVDESTLGIKFHLRTPSVWISSWGRYVSVIEVLDVARAKKPTRFMMIKLLERAL